MNANGSNAETKEPEPPWAAGCCCAKNKIVEIIRRDLDTPLQPGNKRN
jgi:hypothetical protein